MLFFREIECTVALREEEMIVVPLREGKKPSITRPASHLQPDERSEVQRSDHQRAGVTENGQHVPAHHEGPGRSVREG